MKRIYASSIKLDLLDRFIRYCTAANTSPRYAIVDDRIFVVGIARTRFMQLAAGFKKANPDLIFEYSSCENGSNVITQLERAYVQ